MLKQFPSSSKRTLENSVYFILFSSSFLLLFLFRKLCKVHREMHIRYVHKRIFTDSMYIHAYTNIHVVSFHYVYSTNIRKIGWFFNEKKINSSFLKVEKFNFVLSKKNLIFQAYTHVCIYTAKRKKKKMNFGEREEKINLNLKIKMRRNENFKALKL